MGLQAATVRCCHVDLCDGTVGNVSLSESEHLSEMAGTLTSDVQVNQPNAPPRLM